MWCVRRKCMRVLVVWDERNQEAERVVGVIRTALKERTSVETESCLVERCGRIDADVIVSVGGDGTILRTAHILAGAEIPVIGVNVGRLGFLTDYSLEEFLEGLPDVLSTRPARRMMLDVAHGSGSWHALNEAMLVRVGPPRICHVNLFVNNRFVTTYAGDGVVVSTPTGSTAYSLSAGGPILVPDVKAILVTPLNPHTLTNRPLLLPKEMVVRLEPADQRTEMALSVDGQIDVVVRPNESVTIAASQHKFLLVEKQNFFTTLKTKLNWGGLPKYGKR